MIIESGVIIFVGLLLLFIKLPRVFALRLLGRPLALDLAVSDGTHLASGICSVPNGIALRRQTTLRPAVKTLWGDHG